MAFNTSAVSCWNRLWAVTPWLNCSIGCSYDLPPVSRTWLRRPKQGPYRVRKCLAWQIWTYFYVIRWLFHTTDMDDTDSKVSLSTARVAFLDLKFDDYAFSVWKRLVHHLNVLAVLNQILEAFWYFPVSDVTYVFPDIFHCFAFSSFTLHSINSP